MNQPQLPAHLLNRQSRHLSETATQGLGGALPPHISIQGNAFCLIDATGAEQPVMFTGPDGRQYNQPYLDVCIVDISDVICKRYYGGRAWTPDSKDPPVCWSANGVGPSREAPQPQSPTCNSCEWNKRGSAVSNISGVAIKACRDEKWLAVVLPGFGKEMLFQHVLTPGSFQNWKGYVEKFRGQQVDISDVVTRMEFEQGKNGVLAFNVAPQGYIDAPTADLRERLLTAKSTDIFVGRTDMPIQALPAPTAAPMALPPAAFGGAPAPAFPPAQPAPTAGFQPTPGPAPFPPAAPVVPPASFPSMAAPTPPMYPQPSPGVTTRVQQAPSEPGRRKRRTAAEMAAARAPAQPGPNPSVAPFPVAPGPAAFPIGQTAQPAPQAAPAPAAAPPGPAPQFGMVNSPPGPGADLQAMLTQHFGPPPAAGGGQR